MKLGANDPSTAVEALRNDETAPGLGLVLGPNVTSPGFLHSGNQPYCWSEESGPGASLVKKHLRSFAMSIPFGDW